MMAQNTRDFSAEPPVSIPLPGGCYALVDAADAARVLSAGRWSVARPVVAHYASYAVRCERQPGGRKKMIKRHHFITGWNYVDHINGDGLDNRRANLRQATHKENARNRRLSVNNSSGYMGVGWSKAAKKWRAYISPDGRQVHLGLFTSPEDAARARDAAAQEQFGGFARLNFPTK